MNEIVNNLVIVQARMGSTRLPGKIMKDLNGKPLLTRMIERLKKAKKPDKIVIATTNLPEDNPIIELCKHENYDFFRGSANDLLDRHYQCAKKFNAKVISKIPSDVPLIDPSIIDTLFNFYENNNYDFVSNLHPPSFPDGFDVEIFSFEILRNAWENSIKNFEREHTTPYFWENPQKFSIGNVLEPEGNDFSKKYRLTIDYDEDYEVINNIFSNLYPQNPQFSYIDIINYLDKHPEIVNINNHLNGVNWYRHHLEELKTIDSSMTKKYE